MQPETLEVVAGLEVHVELATRSKIFCGCPTTFGAPPNTQVCPVCLGLPGSLPVLNRRALGLAVRAGLALACDIAPRTKFDRKNYFYPDLPKAYQISQYDLPVARRGGVDIDTPEGVKRVGIHRLHLEEDAGKLIHLSQGGRIGEAAGSRVDYNRTGVPLAEIVSEPDLRSPDEAYAYLTALKEILRYAGVSDCNMEEGSLRCDANVSVRPRGQAALGVKTEIKNLNSFKHVRAALAHEAGRQQRLLAEGGRVIQETRLWDEGAGRTVSMRSKEEAHDYRYFPEPDLPEVSLDENFIASVRTSVPELPRARRNRLQDAFGLSGYDAGVLTSTRELADYYESAMQGRNPGLAKTTCNWLTVELLGRLNAERRSLSDTKVTPVRLGRLVEMIGQGTLSGKLAKHVFAAMFETGADPEDVVRDQGLAQISDRGALDRIVDDVLAAHPNPAAEYRAGKAQALGFLVGQVMKSTRGQANPRLVNEILQERLGDPGRGA